MHYAGVASWRFFVSGLILRYAVDGRYLVYRTHYSSISPATRVA